MNRKGTRYIAIFLAVIFFCTTFTITVFAETSPTQTPTNGQDQTVVGGTKTGTAGTGDIDKTGTDANKTGAGDTDKTGTDAGTQTGGNTDVTRESAVQVTFNLNGGTGMKLGCPTEKGTLVSRFKTPTRKGYKFSGWEINGSQVSGSTPITQSETLTAMWTKDESSSFSSSKKPDSVDTKQKEIEAAASEAEAATSDPGTLSSEDWNSLLNSSGSDSSAVSSAVSSQVSSAAETTGGFSTLFLAGVILVVLGIAGVGTFIYLQFIRGKGGKGGKGGPHGPGGPGGGATDDTIVFTDVSSYSDGKKHNSELFGAVRQPVPDGSTQSSAKSKASAAQHSAPPVAYARTPAAKRTPPQFLEKAQAKPLETGKSDFDWEKFFNEEGRGE